MCEHLLSLDPTVNVEQNVLSPQWHWRLFTCVNCEHTLLVKKKLAMRNSSPNLLFFVITIAVDTINEVQLYIYPHLVMLKYPRSSWKDLHKDCYLLAQITPSLQLHTLGFELQ